MPSVYQENFQQTVGKWLCRVIEFQFTGKCLHDLYPSHRNCLNLIGTEIWLPGIGGPWCFQRRRGEIQRFLFYLHSRNLLPVYWVSYWASLKRMVDWLWYLSLIFALCTCAMKRINWFGVKLTMSKGWIYIIREFWIIISTPEIKMTITYPKLWKGYVMKYTCMYIDNLYVYKHHPCIIMCNKSSLIETNVKLWMPI